MAEARDRYLPVRKDDILSALARQRAFADPAGGEKFRRLCEMLAAIYHYEYFEMLERLRGDYFYFNPQVAQHPTTDPALLERCYGDLVAIPRAGNPGWRRIDPAASRATSCI